MAPLGSGNFLRSMYCSQLMAQPKAISQLSGIDISGYPTDDEIRHLVHLLKPHRRGPGKTDPQKMLTVYQSLKAESQPLSRPSLAERSRAR
jgi:hypothetical protein